MCVMFAKSSGYSNGREGNITKAVRILWLGTIRSGSTGSMLTKKELFIPYIASIQINIWKFCTLQEAIEFM